MKDKILKTTLLTGIIFLMFACKQREEQPASATIDKEEVKRIIQAKEDSFASVYNSGELRNIGYYADDAITFFQNREPLVGKDAIINFLKSDVDANSGKISFTTNEVFVSNDGNQVVEVGSFKVMDSNDKSVNTGNYMCLFEKRNGNYVAVRDMSASNIPLQ